MKAEGEAVAEAHRRLRLSRPVRGGHDGARRRQAPGFGEREDALGNAPRHGEIVGAEDDGTGGAGHVDRLAARSLRAQRLRLSAMPISSATTIERPRLHLLVDAGEIFADDAERDELDAGEEHDRHDQRGEAGNVGR